MSNSYSEFLSYIKSQKEKLPPVIENIPEKKKSSPIEQIIEHDIPPDSMHEFTSGLSISSGNLGQILDTWMVEKFVATNSFTKPFFTADDLTFCNKRTFLLRSGKSLRNNLNNRSIYTDYLNSLMRENLIRLFSFQHKFMVVCDDKLKIKDTIDAVHKNQIIYLTTTTSDTLYKKYHDYIIDKSVLLSHILEKNHDIKTSYINLLNVNLLAKSVKNNIIRIEKNRINNILSNFSILKRNLNDKSIPNHEITDLCNTCYFVDFCKIENKKEKQSESVFLL